MQADASALDRASAPQKIVTLTIGIGITAGVFGIVNAVLFKVPPIPEINRVVTIPRVASSAERVHQQ